MSSIVYYVTGHGYGHAVRSSQVIRSLFASRPDLTIHVRSTAPRWLFAQKAGYSRQSMDVGIVQRDSLDMDFDATLQACRSIYKNGCDIVDREVAFVRGRGARMIVGDIPPLCFEIAARAGVPSAALANFTWSGIYGAYRTERPEFGPIIDQIEQYYAKATIALTLPYPCPMAAFPRRAPIPWIARTSRLDKTAARERFGLPRSATVVLLSFGGLGLWRFPWEELRRLRDYLFVATADESRHEGNLVILPDAQRHYENLLRAADVVVTKPGYGIVADALAQRLPVLYTDRGDFPEYLYLVRALTECATAEFIPQNELLAGNLGPYLAQLLSKPPHWPAVSLDGAAAAADKILETLDC